MNVMTYGGIFRKIVALLLMLCIGLAVMLPVSAHAQATSSTTTTPEPDCKCTNDCPQYQIQPIKAGEGLISRITTNVQTLLDGVAQTMFVTIAGAKGFIRAVTAAATLYVAVYGILFTFGMVQVTLYEFAMRMIKMGIIALLLQPNAWYYFDNNVVRFFNQGTDDIINTVTKVNVGGEATPEAGKLGLWGSNGSPIIDENGTGTNSSNGVYPFAELDNVVAYAFSAKAAVTMMGIFATAPYGLPIGLLLVMAMGSLIKSILNALWIYLMSLVLKTLIFGLAPIFIACMLFQRTKHIFDGAMAQVINASLQPIFLFTFFAFYLNLIYACLLNIVGPNATPLCFSPFPISKGTANIEFFWQFEVKNPVTGHWELKPAQYDFARNFPIPILSVLIFLILAELAKKFNDVIIQIAQDISGAVTGLSAGSEGLASIIAGTAGRSSAAARNPALPRGRGLPSRPPGTGRNPQEQARENTPGLGR